MEDVLLLQRNSLCGGCFRRPAAASKGRRQFALGLYVSLPRLAADGEASAACRRRRVASREQRARRRISYAGSSLPWPVSLGLLAEAPQLALEALVKADVTHNTAAPTVWCGPERDSQRSGSGAAAAPGGGPARRRRDHAHRWRWPDLAIWPLLGGASPSRRGGGARSTSWTYAALGARRSALGGDA
jgi:hypothetical protein